ncbi:MAG: hypothetical protein GY795_28320, partial [Desulfobacterales bacterium]|nr:hypothetical protein [Desulfobacterales bacterium]
WSKTFTKTEQNYPVVDRECLAVVAMIEKFKHLLLGRHFTVRTDQISLKSICSNLTSVKGTQRCKRWMLQLEFYSFTVEHIPGTKNTLADMLSRLESEYPNMPAIQDDDENIIITSANCGTPLLAEICTNSSQDSEHNLIRKYIKNGWPE